MPLIGGCESWLRSEAARAACSNSGRSGKPVAKGFGDAKAGSAVKLLGLLAPTPGEVASLLQKGFGFGGNGL